MPLPLRDRAESALSNCDSPNRIKKSLFVYLKVKHLLYLCDYKTKDLEDMSEAELIQLNKDRNCTLYTIQFITEDKGEYLRFYNRFKDDATYNEDLARIAKFVESIADLGALERFFRPEGKMSDRVSALPVTKSKLRLYCLRLSNSILILGNGGVKKTRTYDEDDELRGFVVTLQNFDKLIKQGVKDRTITILENEIETDKTFDI